MGRAFKIVLLCALLCALCGCKTRYITTEVPVVVEQKTHEKSVELRVDTVYHRDSTIVLLKGDTLVERHYNTIYKVREKLVADTLRDTIPKVVTQRIAEVREVNRLHWWQRALMWLGGVCFIALCGTILIKISHKHA